MAERVTAGKNGKKKTSLQVVSPVINLDTARFECTFGRGCDGICCQNGRPPVDKAEEKQIAKVLRRALPLMRPKAAKMVQESGFVSNRKKFGGYSLRVEGTWCVFFHKGCVLHQLGAEDGDPTKYKPLVCALFPLERKSDEGWYVRQVGYLGESWDLHCLKPTAQTPMARETLAWELGIVQDCEEGRR